MSWPPSDSELSTIAKHAFQSTDAVSFKVLVYWDNPSLLMFNPVHYANTEFVHATYRILSPGSSDYRTVEISVGKED